MPWLMSKLNWYLVVLGPIDLHITKACAPEERDPKPIPKFQNPYLWIVVQYMVKAELEVPYIIKHYPYTFYNPKHRCPNHFFAVSEPFGVPWW